MKSLNERIYDALSTLQKALPDVETEVAIKLSNQLMWESAKMRNPEATVTHMEQLVELARAAGSDCPTWISGSIVGALHEMKGGGKEDSAGNEAVEPE
ncbi:hypothetical protein JYT20_00200 [Rhodothermus sp. AH-315-K08]|nr:hypothetical protein [Rhodothermus sp. AH-315-K08]